MWRWWEENIELDQTAAASGRYSTELVPMVRAWCDFAQSPKTRRLIMMVSAQSTKTQNVINRLLWAVLNDPATTMWVMSSKTSAEEFVKKRLTPAIDECKALEGVRPKERKRKTKELIQFLGMNLIIRGANSKAGLQSDPCKVIVCDERREWIAGAIELLRKRLRTFPNCIELSLGTAGQENDELHIDFKEGSQTFIHWHCPKCIHSQPFRFGREKSVLHPEERARGGIVWPTNETTKPNGRWNYAAVEAAARYECEECSELFTNAQKIALLKSWHMFHRNPNALPALPSMHWWAIYMPWQSCSIGLIAVEFLKACDALKFGKIEPMKAFVTETLGEPWRDKTEQAKPSDLLERRGDYKTGERWPEGPDSPSAHLMAIDVQQGYLVFIHRQFKPGGASRLIKAGKFFGFDEAREYQVQQNIRPLCVFVDSPFRQTEVFRACLRWGWNAMLGDDTVDFTMGVYDDTEKRMKQVRTSWKEQSIDPNLGLGELGKFSLKRFSWSNTHYNSQLFLYSVRGQADVWEIPQDIHEDYLKELGAVERVTKVDEKGVVSHEWRETGRHDFADCEKMLLAAADICNLTKQKLVI